MAIEASFTIDQSGFPLSAIFEELPDATVELDRVVPTEDGVIPYFWVHAEEIDGLGTDLTEDAGVRNAAIIDEVEDQLFLRVEWDLSHESILTAMIDTPVTLLSGIGDESRWTFEVRSADQEGVSEFQTYCQERDIQIELTELHALSSLRSDREYDLTEGQQRALVLAYTRGYFDSPREATQRDLADELGISHQAVSSRLQRGIRRLVASTLVTND